MNNKIFKGFLFVVRTLFIGWITIVPLDGYAKETHYIDIHVHLDGLYRSKGRIVKDYETAAANLIAQMDRRGITKALIMPPPQVPEQSITDYGNLLSALKKYPDRLFLVAGGKTLNSLIHGTEPGAVSQEIRDQFEMTAEQLIEAGARGFGEITALHLKSQSKSAMITQPESIILTK